MTIKRLCVLFTRNCRTRRLAPNTLIAYAADLKDVQTYFGDDSDLDYVLGRFEHYVEHLRRSRLKASTLKRRIAVLRSLMNWAENTALLEVSPFRSMRIDLPRSPEALPRSLNGDDCAKLLTFRFPTHAIGVAVALMLVTGIRVGEMQSIRIQDCDFTSGRIRIKGKGARERCVFVADVVLRAELLQLAGRRRRGPLFLTAGRPLTSRQFRDALHSARKQLCITRRITPHMLRHTAATALVEAGTDIRIVQRLLGHASITTTQIYVQVADLALERALARANILQTMQACVNN